MVTVPETRNGYTELTGACATCTEHRNSQLPLTVCLIGCFSFAPHTRSVNIPVFTSAFHTICGIFLQIVEEQKCVVEI